MARIRTIKPEFPQSESMGRVSRDARLLFVMLWTIADDHGRARAHSRMLASLLFPYDDDAGSLMSGWLDELEKEGCIKLYVVSGSKYLQIVQWSKHQKIDKPSKAQHPGIEDATREESRASIEDSENPRLGREGKGKEGSGEEEREKPDAPAAPPLTPGTPAEEPKKPKRAGMTLAAWLESLPPAEMAIPADDPVYAYAERVGLPDDFLRLQWAWFKAKYLAEPKTRQLDWRQKFRNAVEGGWGNHWRIDSNGGYYLTTQGKQLERSLSEVTA